jgi:hypothetical protein
MCGIAAFARAAVGRRLNMGQWWNGHRQGRVKHECHTDCRGNGPGARGVDMLVSELTENDSPDKCLRSQKQ